MNIVWGQIKVLLHRFKNSLFLLWLKIKAALHQFKNYLNVLWGQIKTLLHRFKNYLFSRWVRIKLSIPILQEKIGLIVIIKGGLKLKLIGSAVIIILFTIITLSSIIIYLMKNAIEQKAIEVATTSIERIADFSNHALLERSYENRLTLNEMIKDIRLSKIEGMLDISIYQHVKTKKSSQFKYLAGFRNVQKDLFLEDTALIESLKKSTSTAVTYDNQMFTMEEKNIESFRFVKPIYYTFQKKSILLGVAILYYDKATITGIVRHVIYIATLITLGILVITIFLTYLASLRFTRPILTIAHAATVVSQGDFNIDLKILTNDEIGELANRFNHMVKGLREKEKMQMFISGSTIHMIQEDSTRQLILGGEYRTLTFLFSDIRGFTAMSETKKPEEVVNIINFYLNLQSEIIKAYGGDIDKFVGDEIMVSFMGDESVDKAIQCAIAIQESILKENKKRQSNHETICNVGIGIHRGEVVVGNIGSHERMDFTSIGSTVNLAARLCSHAAAGQILIEKSTCDMAQNNFDTQLVDPILAKGIEKPVPIASITIKG
ncbi:MAG: adenylate/guanylate cyclase domain-containing protein [Candidatus Marinarcus sp.]|uniref:adenylate/guanylate cyclase domain-containing protein n=1 Tax=Candidatus Marinarcus sp. TaxID=3100987 RepID=UPI003B007394